MTRDAFTAGMARLIATWPDRSPSAATHAAYWEACCHLDDTVWAEAVKRCLRECTFFPVPAEILARGESALATAGLLPPEPDDAWGWLLARAQGRSRPSDSRYEHPDIKRAMSEIGGLRALMMAENDEVPWLRKTFVARYGEYRRRRIAQELSLMAQPLPEPGQYEALPEPDEDLAYSAGSPVWVPYDQRED